MDLNALPEESWIPKHSQQLENAPSEASHLNKSVDDPELWKIDEELLRHFADNYIKQNDADDDFSKYLCQYSY